MSLITEYEVIYSSSLNLDFAPSWLSDVIVDCEENFMERCFGWDFYQALIADLDLPTNITVEPYSSIITYNTGDLALYEGRVMESQADGNIGNPINEQTEWLPKAKFGTARYQQLWERYLMRILAMECALPAVTFATIKATRQGLSKTNSIETGMQAASRAEIGIWKDQLRNQIERATKSMIRWIGKETEESDYNDEFQLISFVGSLTGVGCSTKKTTRLGKRRIFWRN